MAQFHTYTPGTPIVEDKLLFSDTSSGDAVKTVHPNGLPVFGDNVVVVTSTIQAAIDGITDAAVDNVYKIIVPPGHENEQYTGKPYVVIDEYNKKDINTANYPIDDSILISGFEALGEWIDTGSPTLSIDTAKHVQGDGCLKAVSNADAEFNLEKTGTWDFTGYDFSLFVQMANIYHFYLYFYSGSDYAGYYYINAQDITTEEMFPIQIVKAGTSINNSIDWSAITKIRFRIIPVTGKVATVYLDNYQAIKTYPHPIAILRFDDGTDSHYTNVRPILESFGYKGTMGIYTKAIDADSNYLTTEQIKNLNMLGWDICSHTHSHPHLKNITNNQVTQELLRSKRILENLGITRGSRFFILPYGNDDEYTPHVLTEIKKYYNMSFMHKALQGGGLINQGNLYHIADFACGSAYMSTIHDRITALSTQNGLIVLTIHTVKASGGAITPTELTALCQHLKDKGIRVVTASELYDDILQGQQVPTTSLTASTKIVVEETLTGTKNIEPFEGDIFYLDPGGINRNIIPINLYNAGIELKIINTADAAETLTFDPLFTSSGTHDGANNADTLTDSGESWIAGQLVGRTINNTTDGSSGVITANTATTITAELSGGTDNDWDIGDAYTITPVGRNQDIAQGNSQLFIYDGEGWH